MKKVGRDVSPVQLTGRKIAATFWGKGWCDNLEAYSDYANRLPRGRTYVRNGSVLDLQIGVGRVRAIVSGTDLYTVSIVIKSLAKRKWTKIKGRCAGQIDSLVELLGGSISERVMEIVTCKGEGLFPSPQEITLDCSCPDWATMCKHVAATLYGVGARLDDEPELLFKLRGVDPTEMVEAAVDQPAASRTTRKRRTLKTEALSSLFGVDIDTDGVPPSEPSKTARKAAKPRKPAASAGRKAASTATRKKAAIAKKRVSKRATPKTAATTKPADKTTAKRRATTTAASKKKSVTKKATRKTKR